MTRVCASPAVAKPKTRCGINNCTKEYSSKSYLKVHKKKVHQVPEDDATADAVIEDEEYNSDDDDDDIVGGTQVFVNAIEEETALNALAAENDPFDNLEEELETEKAYYSMVSHVVTSSFFANKVIPSVINIVIESVSEHITAEVKGKEGETPSCEECVKRKEVEENQEELLKKSDKENKVLSDKLKSMAGQKRFHVNKSKALEIEVESARLTISEMQKRITILGAKQSTQEGFRDMTFSPSAGVGETAATESVSETVTNKDVTEEQTVRPGLPKAAGRIKCRKCNEQRENMKSLGEHMRVKHPNIIYKCDKCPLKYPFKSALKNHFRIVHTYIAHPCNVCKTNFLTKTGLDAHRSSKCKTPAPPVVAPQVAAPQVAAPQVPVPQVPAPLHGGGVQLQGGGVHQQEGELRHQGGGVQQQGQQRSDITPFSNQSDNQWLPRLKCNKCNYEMNTQTELLYHIETKHQSPILKCDKCPQSFENSDALVNHLVQNHTRFQQERPRNTLDNGLWDCSFCGQKFNGNDARDTHVCNAHPNVPAQPHNKSHELCKRGASCFYYKTGRCWFTHVQNVEHQAQSQGTSTSTGRKNMWCAFQDKCSKRQTCVYKQ